MSQQHSPLQQLTALGYAVASGAMRLDVAMSMGVSILARDDQVPFCRSAAARASWLSQPPSKLPSSPPRRSS